MNSDVYDDPDVQLRWITEQRKEVIASASDHAKSLLAKGRVVIIGLFSALKCSF